MYTTNGLMLDYMPFAKIPQKYKKIKNFGALSIFELVEELCQFFNLIEHLTKKPNETN